MQHSWVLGKVKPALSEGGLHVHAAGGDPTFQQVEVDMFRMAALFVVERLKPWLMTYLASLLATVAPAAGTAAASPRAARWGAVR